MNTKLILALAAMMVVPTAALATGGSGHSHSYARLGALGPTTVNIEFVGEFGIALCDGTSTIGLIDCNTSGVGAIIGVSDLENTPPDIDHFAYGDCTVVPVGVNTNNIIDGAYSFSCGVDRDDDGFVTNVDVQCGAVPPACSSDPDGYDDDSAGAQVDSNDDPESTIDVCFRRDRGTTSGPLDSSADHDWDTVAVFIAANIPELPADVGQFDITLNLTHDTACRSGENVSGHTHDDFYN